MILPHFNPDSLSREQEIPHRFDPVRYSSNFLSPLLVLVQFLEPGFCPALEVEVQLMVATAFLGLFHEGVFVLLVPDLKGEIWLVPLGL